jgi:predicted RNA-binding Zn-ribbon protein involved in translation (DUF1610 family)
MSNQQDLGFAKPPKKDGPVECFGMTFESDDTRREHFLKLLAAKLQDPEFRQLPGFPQGSDEAILHMSDPPYYTACPNPFLEDFVRIYGRPDQPAESYGREPLAIDVSEGKYDSLYRAHAYHTKVPHLAIVPSILHYTRPGDIVLDGFCGSGMTGLAAQWCGAAPPEYRQRIAAERAMSGLSAPEWGRRHCILNDLGPAASFIAAGNNLPFDIEGFRSEASRILQEVAQDLGWMYETRHMGGESIGTINVTVWSEVFSCPQCGASVNFLEEATSDAGKGISKTITCPNCGAESSKEQMTLQFETYFDEHRRAPRRRPKRVPSLIEYTFEGKTYQKEPDPEDFALLERIATMKLPMGFPRQEFPDSQMTRVGRMKTTDVHSVDDLFLARSAHLLWAIWEKADAVGCAATRRMLLFAIEQTISTGSVLNRYRPNSSFGNGPLRGVYYVPSQIAEASLFTLMDGILRRIDRGFGGGSIAEHPAVLVGTGDCAHLVLGNDAVDYIFTDPPFGENIYYADLNFMVEAWHGVFTTIESEAIVDRVRGKTVLRYQDRMRAAFEEYYRVLKPGRWMTVVFSNSKNSVWRAIQEGMGSAGFVVADVRTLDKKQGSFKQVTSSAVKQDLVISAYKPTEALTHRFELGHATADGAWAFVKEHLSNVPVFVGRAGEGEVVAERTAQMLLDRMIAFHVQRGVSVPLSGPEFLQGLAQRFPERDGMFFLPDQVAEYDRKRTSVSELRQLSLFVNDEASAIQWVRQQLQDKPQRFPDLAPQYMREVQAWAKHEETVELKTILEQSFLYYDGRGPVPSQIHRYLSSNFKDLRNLDKEDPRLIEKARDRWFVPDPSKQAEREAIREKALLREFEEYKTSTQRKLKIFRTEAVRAGFKACWQERDYGTIVRVAEKLPDEVLQEDEKLLMYYDNALTRLGDE